MDVIVDSTVLRVRAHVNPNPPTEKQLVALCNRVATELEEREPPTVVNTFRFCVEKVYCLCCELRHREPTCCGLNPGAHISGGEHTSWLNTGGYTLRLYADGVPCVGWILGGVDKFNFDILTEEWVDIADVVQLHLTGTWPYCDPEGDRRVALGLPPEPMNEGGLTSPFGLL